ncbi:diacylglycerol kinase [Streptomyces sp. NBC_00083]|uniref:diacylglycerol kinase n=1 Tax=Streptomyces sp. NBC_00083 TaxID=2975647 RepID=UPI00225241CC|nr:diacylglycerol kinase [Streptomyces sp. NBC_00083]MCX5388094.1 diacylglycerol kinase [Streptomyces sp. NBC_00083]
MSAAHQLVVLIDPVARRIDGESVRIAKDVLCAGAQAKICWPQGPEEFAKALARRGGRRTVVVGDDQALLRTVTLLHRERDLDRGELGLIPVGAADSLRLARSLGVPMGAVAAARGVLDGVGRRLDLLVDDCDQVVLGALRVPALGPVRARPAAPTVWGTARSLVRTLVGAPAPVAAAVAHRLRVEADGVLLSDLDQPVAGVSVASADGLAQVVVHGRTGERARASARAVTISGPVGGYRYGADAVVAGPVRTRTWTARPAAWRLILPA